MSVGRGRRDGEVISVSDGTGRIVTDGGHAMAPNGATQYIVKVSSLESQYVHFRRRSLKKEETVGVSSGE